jgi:hypothetical protein
MASRNLLLFCLKAVGQLPIYEKELRVYMTKRVSGVWYLGHQENRSLSIVQSFCDISLEAFMLTVKNAVSLGEQQYEDCNNLQSLSDSVIKNIFRGYKYNV